jgi:hypothetical protein
MVQQQEQDPQQQQQQQQEEQWSTAASFMEIDGGKVKRSPLLSVYPRAVVHDCLSRVDLLSRIFSHASSIEQRRMRGRFFFKDLVQNFTLQQKTPTASEEGGPSSHPPCEATTLGPPSAHFPIVYLQLVYPACRGKTRRPATVVQHELSQIVHSRHQVQAWQAAL